MSVCYCSNTAQKKNERVCLSPLYTSVEATELDYELRKIQLWVYIHSIQPLCLKMSDRVKLKDLSLFLTFYWFFVDFISGTPVPLILLSPYTHSPPLQPNRKTTEGKNTHCGSYSMSRCVKECLFMLSVFNDFLFFKINTQRFPELKNKHSAS